VEVYMRRVLVSVSIMLFLLSSLVACGDDDGGDGAGTNAGDGAAGWTYLDGSGKTTTLAEVPVRIVAHGAASAALIPLPSARSASTPTPPSRTTWPLRTSTSRGSRSWARNGG
jgi:ABC-type Fe3+-hydroxamate transport system substrate-binding protein